MRCTPRKLESIESHLGPAGPTALYKDSAHTRREANVERRRGEYNGQNGPTAVQEFGGGLCFPTTVNAGQYSILKKSLM